MQLILGWLRFRMHGCWLVCSFCLGIIGGPIVCLFSPSHFFIGIFFLYFPVLVLAFCLILKFRILIIIVFASGILLGIHRGASELNKLEKYDPLYGKVIQISGLVSQDASVGEKGDMKIVITDVEINGDQYGGKIWLSTNSADVKRGDLIKLKGKLDAGFGNVSASMYRANVLEITRPYPGDVARRVRDAFGDGIKKAVPEPQVNLGLGYLMGQKTALPKDLEQDIKAVGLTHAVVASGYNLTILVVFSRKVLLRISKYTATFGSIILVFCFMLVTGFSPSMTRAGLVAGLSLLVWYYGRKMHPAILLSFAAALTLIADPTYIWGDLGWYLSFGSFIGVIVLSPLLQTYFWGPNTDAPMIRQLFIDTLSAQLLTWPLILFSFGIFTAYSLPANILVLPVIPLAMLFTFIAGIAGLLIPEHAQLIGLPATLLLKYSTETISRIAHLPNSQLEITFNAELMVSSYILLTVLIIFLIRRTNYDFRAEH